MKHGKIICSGWNYRSHLAETNKDLPKEPIFFLKPSSCIIGNGENIVLPKGIGAIHFEAELALIFGRTGKNIPENDALSYVSHVAAFNDVTARDMQSIARKEGNPWSVAKGMDTFGPMSEPVALKNININDLRLTSTHNGIVKQDSNTSMMIFTPQRLISEISKFMTIEAGDILITGTPQGIDELRSGDTITITVEGVGSVTNTVV
jgi:2-keto-4-pentenoate hydratase/2-oxohepta-3-ene-1,7-dioic acid hydratase (catechol pathway)